MRRALLQQPLIVARDAATPRRISVIDALIRQDEHFLVKLDHPVVVVCHAGIVMAEGDIVWCRPERPGGYRGPPVGEPVPADWTPPIIEQVAAPRTLPELDHDAIDRGEHRAARLTYALGAAALTVLLVLAGVRIF